MRARPTLRAAATALVLVLALGACSDDEPDDDATPANDSGCPADPTRVSELLGYEVVVDEDTATTSSCRYDPVDLGGEGRDDTGDAGTPSRLGARVLVVERRIAEGGFNAVRDAVEVDVGPTTALADGVVDGGRGWVARVGRVVQVGVSRDRRLVQVTVADPALDAEAAQEVAQTLALEALG